MFVSHLSDFTLSFQQDSHPTKYSHCLMCGLVCSTCRPQLNTIRLCFLIAASTLTGVCSNVRVKQKSHSRHTANRSDSWSCTSQSAAASSQVMCLPCQAPMGLILSTMPDCTTASRFQGKRCYFHQRNGFIGFKQPFTCSELCKDHSLVYTGNLCLSSSCGN